MSKRKVFIVITAFVLTALMAGSLGAVTALAWPFSDVPTSNDFYADIGWLDANGITHGCDALGHYCPGDYVTRGQMAAFLHRSAGVQVAAGIHVTRASDQTTPVIDMWFNNVNGVEPTLTREPEIYKIDFSFNVRTRFIQCMIDGNYVDTRDAVIGAYTIGNVIFVTIWDASTGYNQPVEFYCLVYGP